LPRISRWFTSAFRSEAAKPSDFRPQNTNPGQAHKTENKHGQVNRDFLFRPHIRPALEAPIGHIYGAFGTILHGDIHGPELQLIPTGEGELNLSIYEADAPPHFRLTGAHAHSVRVDTLRRDGARQTFLCANHGTYWESVEEIPEPHEFTVTIALEHDGHVHTLETRFAEHGHDYDRDHERKPANDPLYAPLGGDTAELTRHLHAHRHGRGSVHAHWHDHLPATAHQFSADMEAEPPLHEHRHKVSARTALLVILGSSPMVEGIPAFFAAAKYGIGLIIVMALVFGASTIATYVLLCVYSTAGLQRVRLGAFERYGEVLSGAFIAFVGVTFLIWPVL